MIHAREYFGLPKWVEVGAIVKSRQFQQELKIEEINWRTGRITLSNGVHPTFDSIMAYVPMFDDAGNQRIGETMAAMRDKKIIDIKWSGRTTKIMDKWFVDMTIGKFIAEVTIEDLRRIPNVGVSVIEEIVTTLSKMGFTIAVKESEPEE